MLFNSLESIHKSLILLIYVLLPYHFLRTVQLEELVLEIRFGARLVFFLLIDGHDHIQFGSVLAHASLFYDPHHHIFEQVLVVESVTQLFGILLVGQLVEVVQWKRLFRI